MAIAAFKKIRFPWIVQRRETFEASFKDSIRIVSREEIAAGGTSLVYRVNYSNGTREVEKILLPRYQGKTDFENLQRKEFELLDSLKHPFILRPLRFRIEENAWGATGILGVEYIEGVPLSNFFDFLLVLTLEEREAWAIEVYSQLLSVLHYLKAYGVVHGDLAPENILIQPSGYLTLIDFGVSRRVDEPQLPFQVQGRSPYQAPELKERGATSMAGDAYALGRLYELLLGEELSCLEKHRLVIDTLVTARDLPPLILPTKIGWFDGISPLPERAFFIQNGNVRRKTVLSRNGSWAALRHPLTRAASLFGCFLLFSSWLPQRAVITVNTWPYSSFSIDKLGRHLLFETPIRSLQIPSGSIEVEFIVPAQNNRRIVRRINANPGEHVKLFEDFQNLDTLKK